MNKKYLCQFNFLLTFKNNWYKISDEYAAISISKNACSTVNILSWIYQHNVDINMFNNAEYCHLCDCMYGNIFYLNRKFLINTKSKDIKYICIIRDPIERIISAYKTKNFVIEEEFNVFLSNVKYTFNNCNYNEINQHILLQSKHFDFDDVDIFVYTSDYENFCNEHNIPFIKLNQNPDKNYQSKIELTDEHISIIKDIYKEDYEMIEQIKNRGKLYNGTL